MNALAAIHVAKKQLGLDEDTYRAALVSITGKASAKDMTEAERNKVVAVFRDRGSKPAEKGLQGPFAKKLQALWISAWNLGIVRDRSDGAMLAFIKRQTGIDHTRFLIDAADARKAVEALKGWMAREGRVDWRDNFEVAEWQRLPGAQIAVAQWQLLVATGEMEPNIMSFRSMVAEHARPVDQMTERDWPIVMNMLGERIRKVRN